MYFGEMEEMESECIGSWVEDLDMNIFPGCRIKYYYSMVDLHELLVERAQFY